MTHQLKIAFFATTLIFSSVQSLAATQPKPRAPAATHAFYFQVLNFSRGGTDLSEVDREALRELTRSMKEKKQKIEEAHVAVWSDRAFSETTSLPLKDRELADARIVLIEDVLESKFGIGNVQSYNMSRRSNWFARAWSLNSKEIKTLFAMKSAPANVTPEDFQTLKTKGGPMKAVVLFELEN